MVTDTIPHLLFKRAAAMPHAPAQYTKTGGRWVPTSWGEYGALVRRAARALIALGIEPGDTVSLLGFNRQEWIVMDIATIAAGGAGAGIYTTSSPAEVQYIVNHAASKVVLVENAAQWAKIEQELPRLPHLKRVVLMKGAHVIEHPMVLSWEAFLDKSAEVADERIEERLAALEPGGLATLIYTSGTTGPPKGVMLSNENLVWTAEIARGVCFACPEDTLLSYLPLSHVAEQIFSVHGPVVAGYSVHFAESIDKLADNLKEVQPTIFFGVPRIWEKFHAGISQKLAEAPPARRRVAQAAMKVGALYNTEKNEGRRPNVLLEHAHRAFDKLVYGKLKSAVGLGRVRVCISGAAPISREVIEFFASLDIRIQEVYGQSEGSGPTSFNLMDRTRFGSVGVPFPGVSVRIAEDGEILLKGPNVFLGYYKDPAATAETLVYGWLHSGDLGKFDEAGFLWITGRKKEIIITAGGKNIAPKNIEAALKNHPLISEAVVIGDRRKYLTALVTLDAEASARFLAERSIVGAPHMSDEVLAAVKAAVDEVNRDLARVEMVKKFHVLPRAFSIETGELTPTLKVKRNVVYRNFSSEIEAMYAE
jgi:long-chain acyl-CoA synthetase